MSFRSLLANFNYGRSVLRIKARPHKEKNTVRADLFDEVSLIMKHKEDVQDLDSTKYKSNQLQVTMLQCYNCFINAKNFLFKPPDEKIFIKPSSDIHKQT